MQPPLVSVVVVSYNQGKYISQILNSIQGQTYTNWELIVADDASQDHSVEEFENWLKENSIRAKRIFRSKNSGLAGILNEATNLCEGKYVKFIAADDYLHPECLQKSVECLEEKGNSYGMVFTDTYFVDDNHNYLPDIANYNVLGNVSPETFRAELPNGNRIAALTVLMRKDAITETGKYDSKFLIEDYYRWLKINEKYWIAYIPEKLAYYRWHHTNISNKKSDRIFIETQLLQLLFRHNRSFKDKVSLYLLQRFFQQKDLTDEMFTINRNLPPKYSQVVYLLKYQLPLIAYKIISKKF